MRTLRDKVVVVTGAGSGIGRALAVALVDSGARVAVCDVNERAARETVAAIEPRAPGRAAVFVVDVAKRDEIYALAERVPREMGPVDVLVNNAGVLGQLAPLEHISDEELHWIMDVDFWGVMHGVRAFLPGLKSRPEAAIVNVSSLAGLMAILGNAAYFAAKYAVRGFTENLRSELRRTHVSVTVVHPGVVKTNLASSLLTGTEEERKEAVRLYNRNPGVTPERAAKKIHDAILRGQPRLLIGLDVWLIDKLVRIAPGRYDRLLYGWMRQAANKQRPDGKALF